MSDERGRRATLLALALALLACVPSGWAQDAAKKPDSEAKPSMTIYGFAMLDTGYNATQIHPDWYDTMRVTQAAVVQGRVRQGRQLRSQASGRRASA